MSAGEHVTITLDGRDVAILRPVPTKTRWIDKASFLDAISHVAGDPQMAHDIDTLTPGTTEDL